MLDSLCIFPKIIAMIEIGLLIVGVISFILGVYITRWIFGIDKIISGLETQNKLAVKQIRLMAKMLILQGVEKEEIDRILEHGNPNKKGNAGE